ncbi:VOC family protein [Streptomyces beijiangensis]|uniref:VOC family protein n=1 Tax=Streptomyces beijiangensis TaxID=163361 RepID=A0A939FAS6_9ACTN|nr:VOC family protein [Streptomyces beijiangensis]MBO0515796.1 VOC family protein [Streptomyces beijiangensis]
MLSTRFVTGSPNWIDLATPSTEEAVAFYGGLLGWTFVPGPPEFGGYGSFTSDGKEIGGAMGGITEVQPFWSVYFQTADIDSTVKAVEGAGGSLAMGPDDVGTLGRMAGFQDPAGARFSSWQLRDHQGMAVVNEPGTFCWAELYTPDVPAAAAFYHAVYGWETEAVPYPGGTYTMASLAGGGQDTSFGGLIPIELDPAAAAAGSHWLPYFEVADTDEAVTAARRLGGSVSLEPVSVEGVGRYAKLTDPHGARFAVIKSDVG